MSLIGNVLFNGVKQSLDLSAYIYKEQYRTVFTANVPQVESDDAHVYVLKRIDGNDSKWLVQRSNVDTGENSFAGVVNNPTYTQGASAFTARLTLTYHTDITLAIEDIN